MYSIYHIEGVKIGVSKNVKQRMKRQGFTDYEILEEHTDVHKVSDREQQLQKEYGYPVDTLPYWRTIKSATFESRSKGGKIAGNKRAKTVVESGHMERITMLAAKARAKTILQYTKDGNFIKEWESIIDAANELDLHAQNINRVLKGGAKSTGGYIFKYKED